MKVADIQRANELLRAAQFETGVLRGIDAAKDMQRLVDTCDYYQSPPDLVAAVKTLMRVHHETKLAELKSLMNELGLEFTEADLEPRQRAGNAGWLVGSNLVNQALCKAN